jgi:hypothetical protein
VARNEGPLCTLSVKFEWNLYAKNSLRMKRCPCRAKLVIALLMEGSFTYHTPTNSTSTVREKVCLNPRACLIPSSSDSRLVLCRVATVLFLPVLLYISNANVTFELSVVACFASLYKRAIHLLLIIFGKKSHFVQHAGETSSRIGTPRESEQTNAVVWPVLRRE